MGQQPVRRPPTKPRQLAHARPPERPPRVLNRRHDKPTPLAVDISRKGYFGNPFRIGPDGNRDEVIAKYAEWVVQSTIMDQLHELRGRDLICWCAPLKCHGDILLQLANNGTNFLAEEVRD